MLNNKEEKISMKFLNFQNNIRNNVNFPTDDA